MKILLTGATGYLGSHLAETFLRDGHFVGCIVRNPKRLGRLESIKQSIEIISSNKMERITELHFDTVVHTACTYFRKGSTIESTLSGNFYFPMQVLQVAKEAGINRWINTDTCLPSKVNPYTFSKKQFVQWGKYFAEQGEIKFIDLILEHFYGSDAPEDQFLSWVIRKLKCNEPLELTEGVQKRDFIFLDDVVEVYKKVIEQDFTEPYLEILVGTGEAPTIREVVQYLKSLANSASELRFGAIESRRYEHNSSCDTTMMKLLGVVPMYWKDGMKKLL